MRRTALLLACLALAACGQGAAPVAPASGELLSATTVPQDGDTVTGSGRVAQGPGGPVVFCGYEGMDGGPAYAPGAEPPPQPCDDGVPLEGADLAALADRFEKAGAVEGWAQITGTWSGGTVVVSEQGPPQPPSGGRPWRDVPCPAPEGGWPQGPEGDNLDAELSLVRERLPHLLDPNRFALLRPSDSQTLLGFAVADEQARVEAQHELDALVPDRSCVVVARHTDAQVQAAQAIDWFPFAGFRSSGTGMEALQPVVEVSVLVATDDVVAEVARHPDGLVRLVTALRVLGRADRLDPPSDPSSTPPPGPPSAAPADDGVLQPGDRATAVGTVRAADPEQPVTLCHPHQAYALVLLPEGRSAPCLGVELRGLADLPAGSVRVTGTWAGDALEVDDVRPEQPGPGLAGLPDVPCDPPAGGWPDGGAPYDDRSPDDAALVRFSQAEPGWGASGRLLLLRPAPDRQVVTVVVRDQAEGERVRALLEPDFPGRTCIVVQDADVEAASRVQDDPRLTAEGLLVGSSDEWGDGLRTRTRRAMVLRLSEQLVAAERDAGGLLRLDPWLVAAD